MGFRSTRAFARGLALAALIVASSANAGTAIVQVGGDLVFGPASQLTLEIGAPIAGVGYDQLQVAGQAGLGGALVLDPSESFEPALGAALWPKVERLAAHKLLGRRGLTLQASDLAQDAYIALMHEFPGRFNNREHFYALAARIVRNIVVDYMRRRSADKRGSGLPFERLDKIENEVAAPIDDTVDWIAVDAALTVLSQHHESAAQVVELKFFAGLTNEQIAEAMGLSRATVIRHYRYARAWLIDHFGAEPATNG